MRRLIVSTFAITASFAASAMTPNEQLMTPPAGARHYTISSSAGKHGDMWAWTMPDGRKAYRMSMSLRAGYDEVTHINFIMMQAMPQVVVDKANTAARLEGPARYGKDVDLDSREMKAFYTELARHGTIIDPTLTVWEPLMTSDV